MGEGHHLEELPQEGLVVDVSLHDKDPGPLEEGLASPLEGGVVVVVEVVEAEDAVAPPLEGRGDVSSDEPSGTRHEHGHPGARPDPGRGPDPPLPGGAAPPVAVGEVAARGV